MEIPCVLTNEMQFAYKQEKEIDKYTLWEKKNPSMIYFRQNKKKKYFQENIVPIKLFTSVTIS